MARVLATRGAKPPPPAWRRRGEGAAGRILLGAGRVDGVRPQTWSEPSTSRQPPRRWARSRLADRFSIVEVPEAIVEDVIRALRTSGVRGKKVTVRRDKEQR